jgi:uncharacterized membrane protein YczE
MGTSRGLAISERAGDHGVAGRDERGGDPPFTDALERQLLARRAERISEPLELRRLSGPLSRLWRGARRPLSAAIPPERRNARLAQLTAGLLLYGVSEALMLAPAVGVDPWDVFQTGLSRITGIPIGTMLILIGALVLLLWIPLRQRPGLGTVANIVVIGTVVDLMLATLPAPHALWLRWTEFTAGLQLNGVATGLYIGAGLGAGPRDGLTVGLAARGHSIRTVRTGIELAVLLAGWLLGGNLGLGTLCYALAIGPLMHVTVPWFAQRPGKQHTAVCEAPRAAPRRAGP